MKKTLLALALMGVASVANAAAVSSLDGTGTFNFAFEPPGAHTWAGPLAMDTDGILVANAFDFNGFPVDIKAMGDGTGLHGQVDAGVLTLDFSNFGIFWNGGDIPLSSPAVTINSFDAATGGFSATWTPSSPLGGTTWTMEGTVNAVPVPAAVWLFGSGLLGLAGFMRSKKKAA